MEDLGLERFKVPPKDQVRIPEASLRRTVKAIFEAMGESPEDAELGADVLVTSDLKGVESHGASNLMRSYVGSYGEGVTKPGASWRIVRESPGTATIDADKGLVTILGPKFMHIAVDKAREVGVSAVSVFNAGHSGRLGHHAMVAAEEDMIGYVMSAGGKAMVPTFGAEPRFGTNPIAVAAPSRNEAPFLFDVATTAVAGNKLNLARRVGSKVLPNWIAGLDGSPIAEETEVPDAGQFYPLPFGGTREQGSHKGYGFAMVAEIMAVLLSGSTPAMVSGTPGPHHHFAAYNIAAFTDLDTFKDTMDQMLRTLKTTKPAPGHERVLYPGLTEHEEEQERRANGIPLHREVVEWFDGIAAELSVPPLERR